MASKHLTNAANYLRRIKKGAILNLQVQALSNFGLGFASYYFKINGVAFYKIMLIWAISPLASLPVVLLSNTWNTRRYMRYGLLAWTGMSLSLLFLNQYSYLLFGVFSGLTLGCFWVSFNYVFFLKSSEAHHAKDSSIYFILGPLVGIVLPPLGSLIIGNLGYRALFFLTALLSLVPLVYVRADEFDHHMILRFRDADKAFSGLRLMAFYNGALHFFQGNFLTIYALLFLKTQYQVGGLLSYLALMSLVVSFLVAYASDKFEKRIQILYPLLFMMAGLILVIPSIKSLSTLVIVIGAYAVLDNLSLPLRFAIPMDVVTPDIGFWRADEFYGNIGRTIVFAISSLLLYFNNRWGPFIIFSLMTFSFPFIITYKIKAIRLRNQALAKQKFLK